MIFAMSRIVHLSVVNSLPFSIPKPKCVSHSGSNQFVAIPMRMYYIDLDAVSAVHRRRRHGVCHRDLLLY